jgi:protein-S-isoprenylcysteine O-methyltransferase Ste14
MNTFKHVVLIIAVLAAAGFMAVRLGGQTWPPLQIAGAAMGIPALILWAIAHLELGKSFTARAEARELVTSGLYSRIRNPIYVFGSLFIAGMILFSGRPLFLLAFAILIPMQLMRAKKEESVLREKFGGEYDEYKKKTWF